MEKFESARHHAKRKGDFFSMMKGIAATRKARTARIYVTEIRADGSMRWKEIEDVRVEGNWEKCQAPAR